MSVRTTTVLKIPPQTEPIYLVLESEESEDPELRQFYFEDSNGACEENSFRHVSAVLYGRHRHQHRTQWCGELGKPVEKFETDEELASAIERLEYGDAP